MEKNELGRSRINFVFNFVHVQENKMSQKIKRSESILKARKEENKNLPKN